MSCANVRRCLLQAEHPDRPPASVQQHLARCAACRKWQRRLVRLEQNVSCLPVPRSQVKADLLQQVLSTAIDTKVNETARRYPTYRARLLARAHALTHKAWALAAAVV